MDHDAISIQQLDSLAEVDASEWDRLAGGNVIASYGWLRTLEETSTSAVSTRYFLARNRSGLVGAAPCKIEEEARTSRLNPMLFGRFANAAQRLRLGLLPSLVCGGEARTGEPVLLRAGATAAERTQVAEALVAAMEDTPREKGWTICFRYVKRASSPIVEVLTNRGYLRGSDLPTALLELDPSWRSLADFRRHLKKAHPRAAKSIPRELNLARRGGLVIEQLEEPASYRERLHRLMDAHSVRLNRQPFPFGADFFDQLKARLGDKVVIYVARIGEEWAGVLVSLRAADDVLLPMIGVNHDTGRAAAAYFNLTYNRPIEDAIAAGHRRVYFGTAAYETKARRGCGCMETDFYLRAWSGVQELLLRVLLPFRSRRNDSISAPLRMGDRDRDNDAISREE